MKKLTPNLRRFKQLIRETWRMLQDIQVNAQIALENNGVIMEGISNERNNDSE
jgi:hypothetical protein